LDGILSEYDRAESFPVFVSQGIKQQPVRFSTTRCAAIDANICRCSKKLILRPGLWS
jgi:hypothetical protein